MSFRILLAVPALLLAGCSDSADAPSDGDVAAPVADVAVDDGPERATGSLAQGDETLQSGEFLDRYEVLATEGQWLRAEVLSSDFDPYIMVLSPTGEQTDVDDSSAGNTSMTKAVVEATEAGSWTIIVTSYAPGEAGAYTVTYDVLDERPEDADEGQQAAPEPDTETETT